jgi:hypothetical protein
VPIGGALAVFVPVLVKQLVPKDVSNDEELLLLGWSSIPVDSRLSKEEQLGRDPSGDENLSRLPQAA